MRPVALFATLALLAVLGTPAQSAPASKPAPRAAAAPAPKPTTVEVPIPPAVKAARLLPSVFDGWVAPAPTQTLLDAAIADQADTAALNEYGFLYGAQSTYRRDGQTLTLRALQFQDVSGSYGAYSFYRPDRWAPEEIGSGAASDKNHVLFWKGTTVVDAQFSQIGPMSASELRDIAAHLPQAEGNRAVAPPVLGFLPRPSLVRQSTHYALGPAGYAGSGGVLPPQLVGFDADAEAVTANYSLSSGPATLTVIEYPTPQLAIAAESRIRGYIKAGAHAQPPFPKPLVDSDQVSLEVRRSGLLVVLVSGDAIPDESHRLLESVYFNENLVSVPNGGESEIAKTSKLLIGIATLVLIGALAAILLGVFFGGGRALLRIAQGKPASSVYEAEFIRLNLPK
ncbi:MAG TPA: DUF6599 family protein [Terracidiphilus sp.]|nr:DUF6599 family protein [Terracidiphilus sp.]